MVTAKIPSLLKLSGVQGFLAPIFAIGFILLSVVSYPEFSWTNNALSDLGVVPGITSALFNSGLIIGGVLFLNFTIGLYFFAATNRCGQLGILILAAACVALISIGIFHENIRPIHYIASVAFFMLLPSSLLTIAAAFKLAHRSAISLFTLLVALAAAAPWIFQVALNYVPGVAIPEFVSGLAATVWVAVISAMMILSGSLTE